MYPLATCCRGTTTTTVHNTDLTLLHITDQHTRHTCCQLHLRRKGQGPNPNCTSVASGNRSAAGGPAHCRSAHDTENIRAPRWRMWVHPHSRCIPKIASPHWSPLQLRGLSTLFAEFFAPFDRSTCSLSVLSPCSALQEIHLACQTTLPNSHTRRYRPACMGNGQGASCITRDCHPVSCTFPGSLAAHVATPHHHHPARPWARRPD